MKYDAVMKTWKQCISWPLYETSNDGDIRSIPRIEKRKNKGDVAVSGRILKQFKSEKGYMFTRVKRDGKWKTEYIHNLICDAFICVKNKGVEVDHIDRNRGNNRPENLRYVTPTENKRRRFDIRGITKRKENGKYRVTWRRDGKTVYDETFKTYEAAKYSAYFSHLYIFGKEPW